MGKIRGKGDEHACRINYLFQAGQTVAKTEPGLSQFYGQVLTVITEKTAPKKDFTMKRSMCKKCHAILKVGDNATYRLRKNKHKKGAPVVVIGCMLCGERKRLPASKGYKLKAEQDGKIIQSDIVSASRPASPPVNLKDNDESKIASAESLPSDNKTECTETITECSATAAGDSEPNSQIIPDSNKQIKMEED